MNIDTQIKTGFYREAETSDDEATARSDDIETGKSESENVKSEDGNAEIHDVSLHPINELVVSQCKKRKVYTRKTGKVINLRDYQNYRIIIMLTSYILLTDRSRRTSNKETRWKTADNN